MDSHVASPIVSRSTALRWTLIVPATAVVWALLHYLQNWLWPALAPNTPVVVLSRGADLPAALGVAVVLALLAGACRVLLPARPALFAVWAGAALWVAMGGTVDEWLIRARPTPGPGAAAPYLALLPEWGFWSAMLVITLAVCERDALRWSAPGRGETLAGGAAALAITVGVCVVLVILLAGPAAAITRRGQVYFALAVGAFVGTLAGRTATGVRSLAWYWPACIVAPLLGIALAAANPELAAPYQNLNSIPSSGLARALPLEFVAVAFVGTLWSLRLVGAAEAELRPATGGAA